MVFFYRYTLAFISVISSAHSARSQAYIQPVPQCVREFYDPKMYNWISYENTCAEAIHITLVGISKPYSGALDIKPGGHSSAGMTSNEVKAVGGLKSYACPANYVAVDDADRYIFRRPVDRYACKSTNFGAARNPSGLLFSACDPAPGVSEHKCDVRKIQCNSNSYSWCDARLGAEGTKENSDDKTAYDNCIKSHVRACAITQAQCKVNIRQCASGQSCDARTETCSVQSR